MAQQTEDGPFHADGLRLGHRAVHEIAASEERTRGNYMRSFICAACMFLVIGVAPLRPAWADGDYGDSDGDGVANASDVCPSTPYNAAVEPAGPFPGCSVWEICACSGPLGTGEHWKSYGEYVSCITHISGDLEDQGLLTHAERAEIISSAARIGCVEIIVGG